MNGPAAYLELYDYRRRVAEMYRERNEMLLAGEPPSLVLERYRETRDRLFAHHPQSALNATQREEFTGLPYFPWSSKVVVEATVDTDIEPQQLSVATSGEESMPMSRVAAVRFVFDGQPTTLSLYWIDVYGGGLFLPFRDATAPAETYGGGRYLFDTVKGSDFLSLPDEHGMQRIVLDFNYAYNPSCAYNYHWACPLAPLENRMTIPIRAGEKRFA